jgi:hypothetical protein
MSESAENVRAFRGVVDRYIDAQVSRAEAQRISWPGMRKVARANGAIYTSFEPSDGRLHVFPFSREHVWGVTPERKLRIGSLDRLANFAIVSIADEPDTLTRRWSVNSSMEMVTFDTQRPLSDEQARAAVTWATNPYLSEIEFSQIATITNEEIEEMTPELLSIDRSMQEHREAIELMNDEQARAWVADRDVIIGGNMVDNNSKGHIIP